MTRVHLTPESFDLETLFKEAFALDCDDIREDVHGVKRHAPEREESGLGVEDPSNQGHQFEAATSDAPKVRLCSARALNRALRPPLCFRRQDRKMLETTIGGALPDSSKRTRVGGECEAKLRGHV
jgi:hypothetical protein